MIRKIQVDYYIAECKKTPEIPMSFYIFNQTMYLLIDFRELE